MTHWHDTMVDRPETDGAVYVTGWTISGLAVLGGSDTEAELARPADPSFVRTRAGRRRRPHPRARVVVLAADFLEAQSFSAPGYPGVDHLLPGVPATRRGASGPLGRRSV